MGGMVDQKKKELAGSEVWRRRRPLERRAGGQVLCIEGVVKE